MIANFPCYGERLLRNWFKKYIPSKTIKNHESLCWIKDRLNDSSLWHLNRHSVARGVAIGLLVAFIPLPLQMLLAAVLSIFTRSNLPIAVALTWVTNPITFLPINYFIYRVGKWILNDPVTTFVMKDFDWQGKHWTEIGSHFLHWLQSMSTAFLVGLPIVAITLSILGYILIHVIWKMSAYYRWYQRKKRIERKKRLRRVERN